MYIGRFAPTPSGSLHLGSICTALGAYLRARSLNGKIILRIEDLDTPRCPPQATQQILNDLNTLGFHFDDEIIFQSHHIHRYQEILNKLIENNKAYYCNCTRHSLKEKACQCYLHKLNEKEAYSVRFHSSLALEKHFFDELLGDCQTHFDDIHIALKRADGIFSYNFACVIDDIDEKVTEVVRGADLIDMTPIQKLVYRELKQDVPAYLHQPLIKINDNLKYSKQNHAISALKLGSPQMVLLKCLKLLNQDTSFYKASMSVQNIIFCATQGFNLQKIPTHDLIVTL